MTEETKSDEAVKPVCPKRGKVHLHTADLPRVLAMLAVGTMGFWVTDYWDHEKTEVVVISVAAYFLSLMALVTLSGRPKSCTR